MDLTSRELIIGVVSSIIATAIIFVITPLLRKASRWFVGIAAGRNAKFRNSIYRYASSKTPPHSVDLYLLAIFSFAFIVTTLPVIALPELRMPSDEVLVVPAVYIRLFFRVFTISTILFFYYRLAVREGVIDIIKRFDNTLRYISPYTSKREIQLIERDWILMKNYEDFLKINARLKTLRKKSDEKAAMENTKV